MALDNREIKIRSQTVGRYLRAARKDAKLTQTAVARMLRYKSSQFISNWERGIALPPIDVLPKLVRAYGLDPVELVETLHAYQKAMLQLTQEALLKSLRQAGCQSRPMSESDVAPR